jgi:integrase
VLLILLRDAVVDCDIGHDPTLRVKELPERDAYLRDPNCLFKDELPRFLELMLLRFPRFYPLVLVGIFTGARWGELTAIVYKDIDESGPFILLSKAHFHGTLSETKTGIIRRVPITEAILDVLNQHRKNQEAASIPVGPSNLVFPADTGGYHYCSLLHRPFKKVMAEMGLDRRLTPHGMRRTFNNLMRQSVTDKVVIQAITGHSDDRMTEHYSHVSLEEKRSALDKMVAFVGIVGKEPASDGAAGAQLGDPLGDQRPERSVRRRPALPN